MSRTTMTESNRVANPAKYRLDWSGKRGNFSYWNGESNQEVDDLQFVLLDFAASVSGWDDNSESRIYSNFVKNTAEQELIVKESKNGKVLAKGLYADIKSSSFSYVSSLFALAKIDDEWELCQINLKKSSLGSWTEFRDGVDLKDIYGSVLNVGPSEELKKGSVKYRVPVFEMSEISSDLAEEADRVDSQVLQPFMGQFTVSSEEE